MDRDRCIRLILGVGPEFEYEILTQEDWIERRMPPTGSATAAYSSAAMPRISGCHSPATA
jgi:hypothetical protein